MERSLQQEILDTLSPDDPDAIKNREDLRLTNRILGTHRWLKATLPTLVRPGERVLELGAGTGELGSQLLFSGLRMNGLDLWPRPADWPEEAAWHQSDLRTFDGYAQYPVVMANLLLHQFNDEDLAVIGDRIRATSRVIVLCEPTRRRRSQWLFRVLAPILGANHVTLHDGHVSIAAGFRNDELKRHLKLSEPEWELTVKYTTRGICQLIAVRAE